MTSTKLLRVTVVLLMVTGHLAGSPGAPSPAEGSPAATYYCCCPGECDCTADCCNHGPARSADPRPPIMREGAGAPAWHSHERCGAAPGTLQRPTSKQHLLMMADRGRTGPPQDGRALQTAQREGVPSSAAVLATSSPRAPPAA